MELTKQAAKALRGVVRSRFVRDVATTLAAQGASLFFSVVNAALVARLLGPEGKGIFALALMVPNMLGMLLSGGVGIANVYLIGSGQLALRDASRASVSFAVLASLVGGVVAGALRVTGWLRAIVPGVPASLEMLAMGLLPLTILDGYLGTVLMGLQRITTLNILAGVMAAFNALVIALFVGVWRWGLVGAVGASLAGAFVSALLKARVLARAGASFRPVVNLPIMRRMFGFGMKGQVGNILQFFNYRLDTFILNYFQGASAVGIYGSAVSMAELLWQLPNAVSFVIFPKAAAARPSTLNAFTAKVFRVTFALTAVGASVLALGGRTFIEWVYSSAFSAAYAPLIALLPGIVLLGGAKVLANEMAGRGYPHYNSAISATGLVTTVILDLLLIPRMSVLGAALASSIAYATCFALSLVLHGTVVRRDASSEPVSAKTASISA